MSEIGRGPTQMATHQRVVQSFLILFCGALLAPCSPSTAPVISTDTSPTWSPQDDSVAYVHWRANSSDPRPTGIYVVPVSGGQPRLVIETDARTVDWSPDGRRFLFDTDEGLSVCSTSGDSVRPIYAGRAYFPSWSPAGDSIAFDDLQHVLIMASVGGPARTVIIEGSGGRDPEWSPTGDALAIVGAVSNAIQIVTISTTGTLLSQVSGGKFEKRYPSWSVDGKLAWNDLQFDGNEFNPQFMIADTVTRIPRRLLSGFGELAWSTDGTRLALSLRARIHVVFSDGTQLRKLTY